MSYQNSGQPEKLSTQNMQSDRALLIAAMTKGETKLKGVLFSDDSRHFLQALIDLGVNVDICEEKKEVIVTGLGGEIPNHKAKVYVGSAGTAARFLTAYLALSKGKYIIDASEQMKKRRHKRIFLQMKFIGLKKDF
mgnify:CR=1 FL=1